MNDQLWKVYDDVADVYDSTGVEFFTPLGRRLVEQAAVRPGERVLDVGCGRGAVLFAAAEAAGPSGEVVGIDRAPGMIRELSAEIARRGLTGAGAVVMDGRDPGFPPASFDVITASMSIALVGDHPGTFANYARLLKENGRVAFAVPGKLTDDNALSFFQRQMAKFAAVEDDATSTADALDAADEATSLAGHLRDAGFGDPLVVEDDIPLVAATSEEFVRWTRTQGLKLFWDMVPADAREALERALSAELERHRDTDGVIRLSNPVCYVLASLNARREG
ncbi:class I SAM-dependent methyltransferase [Lentzea rhizosphaerae]|uniref:Class I SAM-dependent methyltransferase n=1 Tax=Lentzea rhizosphaerae TaxID=2041025 RepID=A0ABV8BTP5_9PSEU